MTPPFACISTAALSPKVLEVMGTSPLTLLLYLQTLTDYATGERTRPYTHTQAARTLGVSVRTINTYFQCLFQAGLIDIRRRDHGVDFTVTKSEVQEPALHPQVEAPEVQEPAFQEASGVQTLALHEVQNFALQPSRGKTPDSESTNQNPYRGGRQLVGGQPPTAQPPPLTPPEEEGLLPYREDLAAVERRLKEALDAGIRRRILGAVQALPELDTAAKAAAIRAAGEVIADKGWHSTPDLWTDRIRKAAVAAARPTTRRLTGVAAVAAVFASHGIVDDPTRDINEEMRRVVARR